MKHPFLAAVIASALVAPVAFALPAGAESRPLPQKQISRGATSSVHASPQPRAIHLVYGTLSAVRGAALVLRTRRGNEQRVDAGPALAAGTYSAPLFVGKIVAVGGYYDAAHVLHAQSVMRLTRLDPTTSADR